MEQKIFSKRAHNFENESLRSEFDSLFDTNSIVDKRRSEQMDNRIW